MGRSQFPAAFAQPRPVSWLLSLGVHTVVIGLLIWSPPHVQLNRTIASEEEEVFDPRSNKIVWYKFRSPAPSISSSTAKAPETPAGAEYRRRKLASDATPRDTARQIVWTPESERLPSEIKSADFVAVERTPPKRTFKPTEPRQNPEVAVLLLDAPEPLAPIASAEKSPLAFQTRRTYVPPPPDRKHAAIKYETFSAPAISSAAQPQAVSAAIGTQNLPGAPRVAAPPSATEAAGGEKQNVAAVIVSAQPASAEVRVAAGSLPGRVSAGPAPGIASGSERVPGAAATMEGFSLRGDAHTAAGTPAAVAQPAPKTASQARLQAEAVSRSAVLVPLHPGRRSLPAAVEFAFRSRPVYTFAVPVKGDPLVSGEWIIWFADREPLAARTPLMRPPVPMSYAGRDTSAQKIIANVRLSATIRTSGRLEAVTIVNSRNPEMENVVLRAVLEWTFLPASRNGSPVDADAVLEIPFNAVEASSR